MKKAKTRAKAMVSGNEKQGFKVLVDFIQMGCTYSDRASAEKYCKIFNREDA